MLSPNELILKHNGKRFTVSDKNAEGVQVKGYIIISSISHVYTI